MRKFAISILTLATLTIAPRAENIAISSAKIESLSSRAEDAVEATLVKKTDKTLPFSPIPYAFYNSTDGVMAGAIANVPRLAGTGENLMAVGLYSAPPNEDGSLNWGDPNFLFLTALWGARVAGFGVDVTTAAARMKERIVDRGETKASYQDLKGALHVTVSRELASHVASDARIGGSACPASSGLSCADESYLSYGPISWSLDAGESIAWDTIVSSGNFRKGSRARAGARYEKTKTRYVGAHDALSGSADFSFFAIVGQWLNPSVRVGLGATTGKPALDLGKSARGVFNDGIKGNLDAYANCTLETRVFRAANAELHASPTLDAIVAYTPDDPDHEVDSGFAPGIELLFFADSSRGMPMKLGFAYDLNPASRVVERHWEIDFGFHLTY
jgi:hypothetical protein